MPPFDSYNCIEYNLFYNFLWFYLFVGEIKSISLYHETSFNYQHIILS